MVITCHSCLSGVVARVTLYKVSAASMEGVVVVGRDIMSTLEEKFSHLWTQYTVRCQGISHNEDLRLLKEATFFLQASPLPHILAYCTSLCLFNYQLTLKKAIIAIYAVFIHE